MNLLHIENPVYLKNRENAQVAFFKNDVLKLFQLGTCYRTAPDDPILTFYQSPSVLQNCSSLILISLL